MKLNRLLLAQVRAVTRSLWPLSRPGPAAPDAAVRQALKNAAAMQRVAQRQMRDFGMPAAPPAPAPAPTPAAAPPTPAPPPRETRPGQFIDGYHANAAGRRDYKLYVPGSVASADTGTPAPLLVMLHGCTQDPEDFATGTQMNVLAEEIGCLVLYPAQSKGANPSRCWNWFNAVDQRRDEGEPSIIAGMTRAIMDTHAVDPEQVYVAGLSAGGAMATIMGTLYPDLYLAAMKGDFRRGTTSGQPLPIIVFHGDRDTTVHPANGEELVAQGARHLARPGMAEPGHVPDGHAYTRTLYPDDDGTVRAEHWLVHGAGHAWFGGNARGSYTDGKGPDASREMMRFFRTRR
jgi:poly(3-hydroxybutyrate) depolymerase